MARGPGLRIALRLAVALVVVAVLGVALVSVLAVVFSGRDITSLEQQRRDDLVRSLVIDAAGAYNTGKPGWSDVDLQPALAHAASSGTQVEVVDQDGNVVTTNLVGSIDQPGVRTSPIMLGDRQIGTLYVKFSGRSLLASVDNLRSSVAGAVIAAAGLAAILALAVALVVSRRITRPVARLIETARAMRDGDRQARVGPIKGAPAELNELAMTFDAMADSLGDQERLRRDLVQDVAHELRTPLAVLQANCEALLDGVVEHTPSQTASLHEEVVRLGRIVDDLQTLADVKAAAVELTLEPCDLAQIAQRAGEAWEASFVLAGIEFTRDLRPVIVEADAGRLHQVISNLLTNALKFTPSGGRVSMSVSSNGTHARLEVQDSGIGIAPADQSRLFERLWRGGGPEQPDGSGIGLAVAAELVQAHRGTIEVESELGHGSCFAVVLPVVR
jgi:two-component system, OmpR family, sensor histidine kinase BaeS